MEERAQGLPSYPLTMAQVDFRPSRLSESPRSVHTGSHGKPRDHESEFRDSAFALWNAIGEKEPRCWRAGIPMKQQDSRYG